MRNHKHSIMKGWVVLLLLNLPFLSAYQCGQQADGALCHRGLCCSQWGWCGNTSDYCGVGCQSQCSGAPPPPLPATPSPPSSPSVGGDVSSIITREIFEEMLMYRNYSACPARGFYTYEAFIAAARFFSGFATTGDSDTRKRELAAFLGQTSYETAGAFATTPSGPLWGYCLREMLGQPGSYCVPSTQWPCAVGKSYQGRGPIMLSYNYNYGPCGQAIGQPLLENPNLVSGDAIVSFETAIWFWMTPQYDKPSCHNVMIGKWTPSAPDIAAGRFPGYGVTTNIINGGIECGRGPDARVASRIGFYERYCDILGVDYGDNLDCYTQRPFGG